MTVHEEIRAWWDADAATYDASAGHAMTDPVETAAWAAALTALLPSAPASILDAKQQDRFVSDDRGRGIEHGVRRVRQVARGENRVVGVTLEQFWGRSSTHGFLLR